MPAPHYSVLTGQMPFLPPNQQHQSTEGTPKLGPVAFMQRNETIVTGRGPLLYLYIDRMVHNKLILTGYLSYYITTKCIHFDARQ